MEQTKWSHLPNAKHIDWVIASLEEHILEWVAAKNTIQPAKRTQANNDVFIASFNMGRDSVSDAAESKIYRTAGKNQVDASLNAARKAAGGVLAWNTVVNQTCRAAVAASFALSVYDECGYMIESEVGELKIIAAFGDPRAILLLPACIVYNETKVLV